LETLEAVAARRKIAFDWSTAVVAVMVVVAASYVFVRDGAAHFKEVLSSDFILFLDTLPKVLAGALIGAFMTLVLSREVVSRWVGAESGFMGIVVASAFGAILPGGPFTIYPIAAAFLVAGADVGAAVAFITAWTLLGYSRALVWELPFFGFDFVAWRVIAGIPLPIIAGILGRIAGKFLMPKQDDA
jgi:uncharacterized membrane protein YraQ (UPF0718 family)